MDKPNQEFSKAWSSAGNGEQSYFNDSPSTEEIFIVDAFKSTFMVNKTADVVRSYLAPYVRPVPNWY